MVQKTPKGLLEVTHYRARTEKWSTIDKDRGYPRRTPMETPGTDWATSAVTAPAASHCSVHKELVPETKVLSIPLGLSGRGHGRGEVL